MLLRKKNYTETSALVLEMIYLHNVAHGIMESLQDQLAPVRSSVAGITRLIHVVLDLVPC